MSPPLGVGALARFVADGPVERGARGVRVDARDRLLELAVTLRVLDPAADRARVLARLARVRDARLAEIAPLLEIHAHGDHVVCVTARWAPRTVATLAGAARAAALRRVSALVTAAHRRGIVHGGLDVDSVRIDDGGRVVVVDAGVHGGTARDDHAALARLGAPRCRCPWRRRGLGLLGVAALAAVATVATAQVGPGGPGGAPPPTLAPEAIATAAWATDGTGAATLTAIAPTDDGAWLAGTASGQVGLGARAVPGPGSRAFVARVDGAGRARTILAIAGRHANGHHRVAAIAPLGPDLLVAILRRGDLTVGDRAVPTGADTASVLAAITAAGAVRWLQALPTDDGDVRAAATTSSGPVIATSSPTQPVVALDRDGHVRWRVVVVAAQVTALAGRDASVYVAGTGDVGATVGGVAVPGDGGFVAELDAATGGVVAITAVPGLATLTAIALDATGWRATGRGHDGATEVWTAPRRCPPDACAPTLAATWPATRSTTVVGGAAGTATPILGVVGVVAGDATALHLDPATVPGGQDLALVAACPTGPRALVGGGPSWDQLHVVTADDRQVWLLGLTSGDLRLGGAIIPAGPAPRAFAIAVPTAALSCAAPP